MKTQHVVRELLEATRQLGMQVRIERGNFRGGYCKRNDEAFIILNKRHPHEIHLAVLAECLRELPIDTVYLRPTVRRALEEAWDQRTYIPSEEADAD